MNATVLSLVLATVLAPPTKTSAERSTRIYVRTTPPGASIVLDGERLGTSDGLFLVPPGVREITLEMDGYDPAGKTVDVKEGWITRVVVQMERKKADQTEFQLSEADQQLLNDRRELESARQKHGPQHFAIREIEERIRITEQYLANRRKATGEIWSSYAEYAEPPVDGVRKLLLPDADTNAFLDLASGELLECLEPEEDTAYFTKIGKGDLAFDGGLCCLRDGAMSLWEDGSAKPLEVHRKVRDVRIYNLPELPCELLVTTAEKRQFVVNVLEETEDGGLDLEYREHKGGTGNSKVSMPGFRTPAFKALDAEARSKYVEVKAQLEMLGEAVEKYREDMGSSEHALFGLTEPPDDPKLNVAHLDRWAGPYLKTADGHLPKDPWGNSFWYSTDADRYGFGIMSKGPDVPLGARESGNDIVLPIARHRFLSGPFLEAPDRKIQLPDADAKDAAIVLDLAGGELLWFPDSERRLSDFTELGKGDLLVSQREFCCLRGGAVWLVDGASITNGASVHKAAGVTPHVLEAPWSRRLNPISAVGDVTIFELPEVPCELIVVTPENCKFLVRVSGETEEGGLNLRYRELKETAREPEGILEFRVAANEEEAKGFSEDGTELGWYDSVMDSTDNLPTREQDGQTEILLWQTAEKSMTASESGEKKWRVIEVSIMAEPGKPGRIGVVFDQEGGRRLKKLTAANVNRHMAMLVDDQIVCCPMIRAAIGPRVEITGDFSKEELRRLATALQAGMETSRPELPPHQK